MIVLRFLAGCKARASPLNAACVIIDEVEYRLFSKNKIPDDGYVIPHRIYSANIDSMLEDEKRQVLKLRKYGYKQKRGASSPDLFGMSLSGGGIRSATFSLGVIQALAEKGWIQKIDYLSTVSGGGYIGAWLSACIHRAKAGATASQAVEEIEKRISPRSRHEHGETIEIRFLRAYSSYLTPRLGLSGDTLAASAGFVRNLLLNMFIIAATIYLVIAIMHAISFAAIYAIGWLGHKQAASLFSTVSAISLFTAAFLMSLLLTLQGMNVKNRELMRFPQATLAMLLPWILLLSFASCSIWYAVKEPPKLGEPYLAFMQIMLLFVASACSGTFVAYWLLRSGESSEGKHDDPNADSTNYNYANPLELIKNLFKPVLQTICVIAILFLCTVFMIERGGIAQGVGLTPVDVANIILFGPAVFLICFWVCYLALMSIGGGAYSEFTREWLNRLLGETTALTISWVLVGFAALNARPIFHFVSISAKSNFERLGVDPLFASYFLILMVVLIFSAILPQVRVRSYVVYSLVVAICSWIFVIFLVIGSMILYQELILYIGKCSNEFENWNDGRSYITLLSAQIKNFHLTALFPSEYKWCCNDIEQSEFCCSEFMRFYILPYYTTIIIPLIFIMLVVVGYMLIDVNTFSSQNLYRNRLVRCYLGATNPTRDPNPYAGFDQSDDIELYEFKDQRPYWLANTALNLTQGQDLAWQQRKAASFVFSPLWSGYWLESTETSGVIASRVNDKGGYVRTERFICESGTPTGASKGIMVGTVMATSGAAVSSQMGYASRGSRAFLLTLFDMRLGRWAPNPAWKPGRFDLFLRDAFRAFLPWREKHDPEASRISLWKMSSPRSGACYYLRELLGRTNERSSWVYLSDGGHFENLGIYELVRRRCNRIICVDAGADPTRTFEDLGNAVQKCRVDFGVSIDIEVSSLAFVPGSSISSKSFALGTIHYPAAGISPAFAGKILYIKPSMTDDGDQISADISSYFKTHPEFPHEPTHDQWFTESQFESYRQLGYLIAKKAIAMTVFDSR